MPKPTTLHASLLEVDTAESKTYAIFLTPWLDQHGTDLAIVSVGSPSFRSGPDEDLAITELDVNATSQTSRRKGTAHPAGEVIFFKAAGGTSGKTYEIKIPFTTDDDEAWVVIQPIYVI